MGSSGTVARRGAEALAGAVFLALVVASCSGGSGSGGTRVGSEMLYPHAVSLVDGQVGDSPFADSGASGRADGRNVEVARTPITVTWSPPAGQVNGDPESGLAGYRIYFGHKPGNYLYVIELGDPAAQSYRLAGLPPGTYYFAVSAVDTNDHEGPLSSVGAITVN